MAGSLKYLSALFGTSLKATLALRGAFWAQAFFMLMNNVIFFSVWLIFFNRFESIGGWQIEHLALLYGTVSISWGLSVILCGGVREMAYMIVDGDLDSILTLPRHPLLRTIFSQSRASGWGDLTTGLILFTAFDVVDLVQIPLVLVSVICGAMIFVAAGVIASSLAFWLGPIDSLATQLVEYLMIFALYPNHVFGIGLKILLYTLLPAAFIGTLPVELILENKWGSGLVMVGGTALFVLLALLTFKVGLKRYASGNRMGVRG